MYFFGSAFVSKSSVRGWPGIGKVAELIQCIFIDRVTSDRSTLTEAVKKITDRQLEAEQGLFPPLIIYPEGATTNGKSILKFKRGAFAALRPVQPIVMQYWTAGSVSAAQDIIGTLNHILLIGMCGFTT